MEVFDKAPMSGLEAKNADMIAEMLVSDSGRSSWYPDVATIYSKYALTKEPENSKYINTYARVLYCQGDLEQAVLQQKKGLKLDPDNNIYKNNLDFYISSRKAGAGDNLKN